MSGGICLAATVGEGAGAQLWAPAFLLLGLGQTNILLGVCMHTGHVDRSRTKDAGGRAIMAFAALAASIASDELRFQIPLAIVAVAAFGYVIFSLYPRRSELAS